MECACRLRAQWRDDLISWLAWWKLAPVSLEEETRSPSAQVRARARPRRAGCKGPSAANAELDPLGASL